MAKIIHIGDLHLGIKFHKRSLLDDQAKALEQVVKYAAENDAHVIVAGDIFDSVNPSIEAQRLWYRFLCYLKQLYKTKGLHSIIIAGNHDSATRLSLAKEFLEDSGIYIVGPESIYEGFTLLDQTQVIAIPFLKPTMLERMGITAETYDDAFKAVLQHLETQLATDQRSLSDKNVIIVAHQTFEGAKTGESEFKPIMSDAISLDTVNNCNLILAGHIHSAQALGPVHYCGSLLPYAFGDDWKSGINLWSNEDGDWQCTSLPLKPAHELQIIRGSLSHCLGIDAPNNYVKVVLEDCTHFAEALTELQDHFPLLCTVISNSQDTWEADLSKEVAAFSTLQEALDAFCEHLEIPAFTDEQEKLIQEALDAYSKTED